MVQRENLRLKQEVLDFRRAFRACNRGENGTAILEDAGWSLDEDPLGFSDSVNRNRVDHTVQSPVDTEISKDRS